MPSSSIPPSDSLGRHLRIDTEHHALEMMKNAVNYLQNHNIDIQLKDEAIVLIGSVDSWSDKQIAQESIRAMSGKRVIHNELAVNNF